MRTLTFANATSEGQTPQSAQDWPFEINGYEMMFDQSDGPVAYDEDKNEDDVHHYSNYLNEDLHSPPIEEPADTLPETTMAPEAEVDEITSQDPPNTTTGTTKQGKKPPATVDPFAAGFLHESLGTEKWTTFSARLFERRLTGPRSKHKKPVLTATPADETTASVIDFLCKAEAVKEVLRVYVPHPYNPHKTLTHTYTKAPTGRVTLSRSTVLALSGWSNTQFSYWARRAEAIGVLAYYDSRLKNVALALTNRLQGTKVRDEVGLTDGVTGKGLDLIIEEVKERTGASPFIHGKHSSLDAFTIRESEVDEIQEADGDNAWPDVQAPAASSHFISTTYTNAEPEPTGDGSHMQYYLQSMEYGQDIPVAPDFDLNAGSVAFGPSEFSAITKPSIKGGVSSPKKVKSTSGRAKRGSKDASSGSKASKKEHKVEDSPSDTDEPKMTSTSKRKAAGNAESPRKRTKTEGS